MSKRIYKTWEDIYPLTLIRMRYETRYGESYVAFNAEENSGSVQEVNREEVSYELREWLERNVDPLGCPYGVGKTVIEAMNNLLEEMNKL
jgi:hypothetical protein